MNRDFESVMDNIINVLPEEICKIHQKAYILPEILPFTADVRKACEANRCGRYGTCWSCPPGVGDWQELRDKYRSYTRGIVYTTCHDLEDSYDFDGMMEAGAKHRSTDEYIASELGKIFPREEWDILSAGACNICKECTYPNAPCRFPEKMHIPMESAGIDVVNLSKCCGINYMNGVDTVTYFSLILKKD